MATVVIRTVNDDNTALMPLASVLATAPEEVRSLVLVDASPNGVTARVNDALNMYRQAGWMVLVNRRLKGGYHAEFAAGLRLGRMLSRDFVHHFDDDVVVLPSWWTMPKRPDRIQSRQVAESSEFKGFVVERGPGQTTHVSAHAMQVPVGLLTDAALEAVEAHDLSIFEDMLFCSVSGGAAVIEGVGVFHSARNTGEAYVRRVIEAAPKLFDKHRK